MITDDHQRFITQKLADSFREALESLDDTEKLVSRNFLLSQSRRDILRSRLDNLERELVVYDSVYHERSTRER